MKTQTFQLSEDQEYIQLNNLLKLLQIAQTGGHAKIIIQNEEVKVNGKTETQIRKKLRKSDLVEIGERAVKIV